MRHFVKLSAGLAACLCVLATASDALAKSRRSAHRHHQAHYLSAVHHGRAPLVVQRRSWLDPGTVVPVGTTNRYVIENTVFAYRPVEDNQRSWFMQETLPNCKWWVMPCYEGQASFWWP
jgi:hypothetical protein